MNKGRKEGKERNRRAEIRLGKKRGEGEKGKRGRVKDKIQGLNWEKGER